MSHFDLPRLKRPDTPRPKTGIVHLGLGAFFRAHGAIYIKEAMALSGGDWGVIGISLKSPGTRDKLQGQDWAYTAAELSGTDKKTQIIDIINNVLVAPENPANVLAAMADPNVKIVSLTVTEKGYCYLPASGKLDENHPDILHDMQNPMPKSAPGFIVRALQMRKQQGIKPFTVLSLDNLPSNGVLAQNIICDLAEKIDPELGAWIAQNAKFPSTMVDRIVPATTDALIADISNHIGQNDLAPIGHEPFRQWAIEDDFVNGERPAFEKVGAQLVKDVTKFEHMKLRMLNGTHSAVAYLGALAGHKLVSEAVADPIIVTFLKKIWREEIIPSLTAPDGVDLTRYADLLLERYQNTAIEHRLEQIAMDGSQKLPQRILAPLFENLHAGSPYKRLTLVVAAWIKFLHGLSDDGIQLIVSDPLKDKLDNIIRQSASREQLIGAITGLDEIFGNTHSHMFEADLQFWLEHLDAKGAHSTMGI